AGPPPLRAGTTWVVDLDGVVWLAGEPIPGVAAAVERLRAAGIRVLFATNNSALTVAHLVGRLGRAGIPAGSGDVLSSAEAAATMVAPGAKVLALAEEGVTEALARREVQMVDDGPVDAVVVGWTRHFDFDHLTRAARAVLGGARLIGTNDDPSHPTPAGLIPGTGALLVSVATVAGAVPEVAGKPYRPLADLITARVGPVALVVGDRASTDGQLAQRLGSPFALVLSGVTAPGDPLPDPPPDHVAGDLGSLVAGGQ
ncbi:MAG: HAD-IIA family hydrolase, partial [Acidimicrobiales bacterium]